MPTSPSPRSPSCVAEQSFEFKSEAETRDPGSLKKRRNLLNNKLRGYRQEKLKRKLSVDSQLLNIAQEDIENKKKIFAKIDDMDKQQADNMKKLSSNMEQLTSSIVDGFAMLRQMMMQPLLCLHNLHHILVMEPTCTTKCLVNIHPTRIWKRKRQTTNMAKVCNSSKITFKLGVITIWAHQTRLNIYYDRTILQYYTVSANNNIIIFLFVFIIFISYLYLSYLQITACM